MMKKKIRAGLMHFLISLFFVSIIFFIVLLFLYPHPYFEIMEVDRLLLVLALVDVCIGPTLTFIIFNAEKKWLKFELAFIAILQLSALAYGAHTVFSGRPVFLVFDENGFTLVSSYQIPEIELKKTPYSTLSMTGPKLVGAKIPSAMDERKKYVADVFKEHIDLPRMLQYHVPYETVIVDVKKKMAPLDRLLSQSSTGETAKAQAMLENMTLKDHLRLDELGYLPMLVQDRRVTIIVRRSDASIVKFLSIEPIGFR